MKNNKPIISIIVAIAENGAIGKNNQLLWHISNDLKRFKTITSGHTVLMGKRTYASLPNGALPKRRNIVLTDNVDDKIPGCETAHSIDEALAMTANEKEVFIIGGGLVYAQFLPLADRLYLTIVEKDFEADTYFPAIDFKEWKLIKKEVVNNDSQHEFVYRFENYERV